jgi:hypothetical protein
MIPRAHDRGALLGFGSLAMGFFYLLDLRYVATPNELEYWEIANGVIMILAILAGLALAFPRLRNGLLLGGSGVYGIYFVIEGMIRRQELAGDILPGVESVSLLQAIFNMAKVAGKLVVGGNAPVFLLPLAVIAWLLFPWKMGERSRLMRNAAKWVLWGLFAWTLFIRLPNPDAWVNLGGLNRILSAILPLGMLFLAELFPSIPVKGWRYPLSSLGRSVVLAGVALLYLVSSNTLLDASSLEYWALLKRHPFILGSERYLRMALAIEPMLGPEGRVAVVTAGIIPYFTDRPAIDLLGKCDPVVARTPMHVTEDMPLQDYRPGHMKWEYSYSLGVLQPDLVVQIYGGYHNPETLAYLDDYSKIYVDDFPMFVLNTSSQIVWENVPAERMPANP